jgi:hypothetical protein
VSYHRKIRKTTFVFVGCGGIGSLSAILCAGAGVRTILLIDGDSIEKSNLNRQLFWKLADINKPKVKVLKAVIEERFDNVRVVAIERIVRKRNDLRQILSKHLHCELAVMVHTADRPLGLSTQIAEEVAEEMGMIFVAAGYQLQKIIFGPIGKNSSTRKSPNPWFQIKSGIMPSFGPQNAIAAGFLSFMAIAAAARNLETPKR